MPIGAVVARASLMKQWKKGAHGNTYGGNPVCCAASERDHRPRARAVREERRAGRRALHEAPR
jgi:acetylornithine/succinyldiaminopimelate/putrescine aminotransferase